MEKKERERIAGVTPIGRENVETKDIVKECAAFLKAVGRMHITTRLEAATSKVESEIQSLQSAKDRAGKAEQLKVASHQSKERLLEALAQRPCPPSPNLLRSAGSVINAAVGNFDVHLEQYDGPAFECVGVSA